MLTNYDPVSPCNPNMIESLMNDKSYFTVITPGTCINPGNICFQHVFGWDPNKMAAVLQTIFWQASSSRKGCIWIRISLKFCPGDPFYNILALAQVMAWCHETEVSLIAKFMGPTWGPSVILKITMLCIKFAHLKLQPHLLGDNELILSLVHNIQTRHRPANIKERVNY